MSIARHHAEWLSLVEVSGPFLSMPVLMKAFPQGLEAHDPDRFRKLRLAYEEWTANEEARQPDPFIRRNWIKFILREILDLPDETLAEGQAIPQPIKVNFPEHSETLRPDIAVKHPDDGAGKVRLLIQIYPPSQDLDKPIAGRSWKASPATRMMELLHASDIRLGLITNGERWMLVDAPRNETTGFASWYASLWLEEKITFQAFRTLLGVERFFNVPDDQTLEALLAESAQNQQEVTDQLGYQVRRAVEVLIQSLDRADQDHGRQLLVDIPETELYEAALTVMMRLVFLFCAEERGLLLLGDPLYDENYAVSTLREHLRETADQHGEEILERRQDAWCRLISTFRAVHAGVQHERMSLPAYGGDLFDPDRFVFLEGRQRGTRWQDTPADPLPVNNRTVLHLLESLQMLEIKVPGGGPAEARRLSFRALDIEQIGHVYEGLLDHTCKRATEPMLGLCGAKYEEPEVALPELERRLAKGAEELVEFLEDETKRSPNALKKALSAAPDPEVVRKLRTACGNSADLLKRITPFANLVRNDTFGMPVVILPGSAFVTAGQERRATGTHYTPRSLTEPIVQYTLEPLVYEGPAEGKPREEWKLRSAKALLDLKICDMACGSGAFLVQADRYLSERVCEAWEAAEAEHQGVPGITPEGEESVGRPGEQLVPKDLNERMVYARRIVAQRCLYGVDKNPLAVEMAKLSLWLLTVAKYKPFTFLNHAIRCGDSLVGLSAKQIAAFHWDEKHQPEFEVAFIHERVNRAIEARRKILTAPETATHADKEQMLAVAEEALDFVRFIGDLVIAAYFGGTTNEDRADRRDELLAGLREYRQKGDSQLRSPLTAAVNVLRSAPSGISPSLPPFHWEVEFPEVFGESGGFNAFVGNPPFISGTSISTRLGDTYTAYLKSRHTELQSRADICVVFMRRGATLLRPRGAAGLLGSDSASEGDSRLSGPAYLLKSDYSMFRAVKRQDWPGSASVKVCQCYLYAGDWAGDHILNGCAVPAINSSFDCGPELPEPHALAASKAMSFTGTKVYGNGFVLPWHEGHQLRSANLRNRTVIKPYMIGRELNDVHCKPGRYIIDFTDMSRDEASTYQDAWQIVLERVRDERKKAPEKRMREYWWQFQRPRRELYELLATKTHAWLVAATSDTVAFVAIPYSQDEPVVFSHAVNVLVLDGYADFAVVQSSIHLSWSRKYGSSLKGDMRYTTTDCFESYPFPGASQALARIGQEYYNVREDVARKRTCGLTTVYHAFHDATDMSEDIEDLRQMHGTMDEAVAEAYGWEDLSLDHGFHDTNQGVRFTISDKARQEVLTRLLKLNHERYAEEVAQGLHEKKKPRRSTKKRGRQSKSEPSTPTLFDENGA